MCDASLLQTEHAYLLTFLPSRLQRSLHLVSLVGMVAISYTANSQLQTELSTRGKKQTEKLGLQDHITFFL